MKKIINGKKYDTDTASCVGSWDNGYGYSEFGYFSEALYRKDLASSSFTGRAARHLSTPKAAVRTAGVAERKFFRSRRTRQKNGQKVISKQMSMSRSSER